MKPLNPNSMIQGRYLIVQPIGKGGMGEVYLAVDQRLGSAVALKRTFFSEDSTLGTAFEREARILARLRHPVLPKVIDHFAENGDQFLVMEHISGDDIAKRLEVANKPFPVSWVMFWSDQMLDALAYLHSHEPPIVHRDIKPQNLKLTDDNHIVLLDFGLSKDFDSKSSGLNSASVAGYSPHFASMEQIRGTGTDARSDLYSLAATLYQMLTNVVPPDALTRADAMLGGKGDPIRPLNELNPEVTSPISDVILKAVAIRQDERFGTANEMQKALRRAFNKEKAEANGKPTPEPRAQAPVSPAPVVRTESTPAEKEIAEAPEMETQIRIDTPVPVDATLQMPKMSETDQKQSELKTAVFNVDQVTGQAEANTANNLPQETEDGRSPAFEGSAGPVSIPVQVPPVSKAVAASASAGAATQKKKSKAGLIVGLLVGLFLLVGAGGAAAWYLLIRSNNTPVSTPNPPANVPPPAATPVSNADSNQAVANSNTNSNSEIGGTANSSESNSSNYVATTNSSTPKPSTPVTSNKPTAPAKPPTTAGDKSTPKTKPKDDRTVILQ